MPVINFPSPQQNWRALEFFAGIGLARAGLENHGITTTWANDYDASKQEMYHAQWGDDEFVLADVHDVVGADVPDADVAWSSSPCTDLSLAGNRRGLRDGRESSAFFGFTRVLHEMDQRRPPIMVLENVVGLASSRNGEDFRAAITELNNLGYAVDTIVLDARRFLPQSRRRLFIVGAIEPVSGGNHDTSVRPDSVAWIHQDKTLNTFCTPLKNVPDIVSEGFTQLLEHMDRDDSRWWDSDRTSRFLDSMSNTQRARLDALVANPFVSARTAYRRTRGGKPMWEMRAEDIAGCLRTARGGSSKQAVVVMGNNSVRIRWMTGLEYARLMGAGWFNIEGFRESQIHYGFGDAVVVPAVSWVAQNMIVPLLEANNRKGETEHVV